MDGVKHLWPRPSPTDPSHINPYSQPSQGIDDFEALVSPTVAHFPD